MGGFDSRAKEWDKESRRVQNAKSIADVIKKNLPLSRDMKVMDLGAGTGLLSYFLSDRVGKVVGVDNSAKMLEVFKSKKDDFHCHIETINADFSKDMVDEEFDIVVSSMTIHHIKDTKELFEKLYNILTPKGYIALADLDQEDGTFHSDNSGVYHYGFDFNTLAKTAQEVGFIDVKVEYANSIKKPHGEYKVFVLFGQK